MHFNVAIKFKAIWSFKVTRGDDILQRDAQIAKFVVIPRQSADGNKIR